MSPRAAAAAIAGVACAVLAGAGCTSISLRATEARTPILLGPVACMGCAPEPARGAATPTVASSVREREYAIAMFGTYASPITHETKPLDAAAADAVSDPCREELRVSRIDAGTWVFDLPLLFAMGDTRIDVQASRAAVPGGSCGRAAGGAGAAPEKPRAGRKP